MRCTLQLLVIAALALVALAAPPQISEEFETITRVTITDKAGSFTNTSGHGFWASTLKGGKSTQRFEFGPNHHLNELHLRRFDLLTSYEEGGGGRCEELPLEGPMEPVWGWLAHANQSTKIINNEKFDAWSLSVGYATVSLYLNDKSVPRWYIVDSAYRVVSIEFMHWVDGVPAESMFTVPRDCRRANATTSVGCLARATMIAHAQTWVTNHVPYSQTGSYGGYRTDCSGYVSMAWEAAKPGYTTFTLPQISHPITKAQLQPGDILLCKTEHVVIFGGWSGGQSHYIAYEETRPGEGTVSRVTPYPYWYNTGCFLPYRYNSAC